MYHISAEESLTSENNSNIITGVTINLNTSGLRNEVSRLREKGYKVKLYSDGRDKNLKHLVAIKKDEMINEIEKPFIEINIEKETIYSVKVSY